jgi:hypothetical protein
MSNGNPYEAEGRSDVSFREAAKRAVHAAELKHARANAGDPAPKKYALTLMVEANPGSSLSEYIVVATPAP